MPAKYQWNELHIQYPENWSVAVEDEAGSLNIETPQGAFMNVSRPKNLDQALQKTRQAMEREYEEVETESVSRVVGEYLLEGVAQQFIYLDLVVTCYLFKLESEDEQIAPLLVQIQGEDRELDRQMPVFEAILASLTQATV